MALLVYCCICIIFLFIVDRSCAQDIPRVQCFDGCSASPALLGTFPTIGECCGFEGLQGGGFLLAEDPDTCINCTNFRTINGKVILTTDPSIPVLGSELTLLCQVEVNELLRPSIVLFLQLPNGTVIESENTSILLEFDLFTLDDMGRYYCNASVTSPEFPQVGLRIFQSVLLEDIMFSITDAPTSIVSTAILSPSSPIATPTSMTSDIPNPTSNMFSTTTPSISDLTPTPTPTPTTPTVVASINSPSITHDVTPVPIRTSTLLMTVTSSIPRPVFTSIHPTSSIISSPVLPTTSTVLSTSSIILSTALPTTSRSSAVLSTSSIILSTGLPTTSRSSMVLSTSIASPPTLPTSSTMFPSSTPLPICPTLSIVEVGLAVVGKVYGLTCQAPGLIKDLQWFSHDGDPIMSSHTVRVGKIVQQNEISSLTLYFCPLSPEDAGRYFCKSNSLSAKVKITVQTHLVVKNCNKNCHTPKCMGVNECICNPGYSVHGKVCIGGYICKCPWGMTRKGIMCYQRHKPPKMSRQKSRTKDRHRKHCKHHYT